MISKRTLLILGAGASMPYGFPSGTELAKQIKSGLSTQQDRFCTDVMSACGCTWEVVDNFRSKFDASKATTIDEFLASETEDIVKIGKVCIARALIPCEISAKLSRQDSEQDSEDERWYAQFFEKLLSSDAGKFPQNKLSVITYNYDRSFEQCLFSTIREKYKLMDDMKTREVFNKYVDIIHLHGVLGELPGLSLKETSRPYSPKVTDKLLRDAANQIVVIHEVNTDWLSQHGFPTAQNRIDNANVVCFLGFGYKDKLLEYIFQKRTSYAQSEYKDEMLGTCVGVALDQQTEIKARFAKLELSNLTVINAMKQWGKI